VQLSSEPLVIAQGEENPWHLAIDDRYVYWVAGPALRRAPLDGGPAETLAAVSQVASLAAVSGSVFFTDLPGGRVVRVDGDGTQHVIGHGLQPQGIAVRDGQVFWTNSGMTAGQEGDGSLASARSDGSEARVLLDKLISPSAIAVDDTHIYFSSTSRTCWAQSPPAAPMGGCAGGGIRALPRAGGEPIVIDPNATTPHLGLAPQAVFWIGQPPTRMMSAPLAGSGSARVFAELQSPQEGPLAVDTEEGAIYLSATDKGRVIKLAFAAAEPIPIALDLESVGDIAVDARGVYVAAPAQGRIVRFPKDGSAAKPTAITGPCPTPLGAAGEIAATPRDDAKLELLALRLDRDRVVARQDTYERVVADVRAIRALDPTLSNFEPLARDDGKGLSLRMSDLAFKAVEAKQYSAWDCLNDFYGVTQLEPADYRPLDLRYVNIMLKGTYNLSVLKDVYAKLPGVLSVDPSGSSAAGRNIICARREAATTEYIFDRGAGDCLSGCTEHHAQRFTSTAPGIVEAQETWVSSPTQPAPLWFTQACRDR
jgi:hypothetical protein